VTVAVGVAPAVRRRIPGGIVRALSRRLARAARRLSADPGALGVRIVDDAEMEALHLRHLGLPGPTDVLSFPAPEELDLLGDVVIDWDAALRQAGQRPVVDELVDLGVHGLVHLLGCDHDAGRAAAREMLRLEQRACRVAGLPPPRRPYGGSIA
jgi:probable rRNA maturation factor